VLFCFTEEAVLAVAAVVVTLAVAAAVALAAVVWEVEAVSNKMSLSSRGYKAKVVIFD
jgi:hypothetical protein